MYLTYMYVSTLEEKKTFYFWSWYPIMHLKISILHIP